MSDLFVDVSPIKMNRFRSSVASALPFLDLSSGPLETASPLFPLSASLLRDLSNFDITPSNIEWQPADIPTGSGRLLVSAGPSAKGVRDELALGDPDLAELRLLHSGKFHGSLSTTRDCLVSSNIPLLLELASYASYVTALVAVGTLFAEDFDARELLIPVRSVEGIQKAGELGRVCESVGLMLNLVEVDSDEVW
ncbi:hypothetical protein ACQBAT_13940 [Ornithinimicrobium sp. Y1847]|uniref:hypothetical protein n=1 Tax=Ornithinimicrobium sp. Y1847 TaxID=3405419 RepID=UPI003B67039B